MTISTPAFAVTSSSTIASIHPTYPSSICKTSRPPTPRHFNHSQQINLSSRFHGARLQCNPFISRQTTNRTKNECDETREESELYERYLIRCYADGGEEEEEDDDDDYNDEPDIILKEDSTGRSLPVGIDCIVPHNDMEYYVCYPMDDPVAFVKADDTNDELYPVNDQHMIDKLFPNASAVLSEMHLQLQNTPYVLTLSDFSEDMILDTVDAEDNENDQIELGDDRSVEVIAEFVADGTNYYVVRPLEEVLVVAKSKDGVNFTVIDDEELDSVSPTIEDFLEQRTKEMDRSFLES